ncbi:hypothetical protein [Mycobacterium sp. shizuoka-1]|uniref:hypothetical protein n=1 Tax=Mycobacterium sp. shizuoka-1 TaxID=2039281 RepID=UPI000C06627A|nr:hypothetical protein [Mycobacterium sp. shizuoka-1]GAY19091.1 hypothetical protein MSZK_58170 [Mycobacterium sp. shizuoka-1]
MTITFERLTGLLGAVAAVTVIGGFAGAQSYAATPSTAPTIQQETSAQTLITDPTKSFAMRVSPTVKATPFWGEPKAS